MPINYNPKSNLNLNLVYLKKENVWLIVTTLLVLFVNIGIWIVVRWLLKFYCQLYENILIPPIFLKIKARKMEHTWELIS